MRIIACYGPQEDEAKDVREEFFEDVAIEINKCKIAEDQFIILGDLNAKLEADAEGCLHHETANGKLLLGVIDDNALDVVNVSSKCTGKWTCVVRTSGKMSRLDYVLTCPELQSNVISMTIDEACLFCPFSQKTVKGETVQQYSDHNSILVQLTLPRGSRNKENMKEKAKRWRITEDGLDMFHKITDGDEYSPPQVNETDDYNDFEMYLTSHMQKCFKEIFPKKKKEHQMGKKYQEAVKSMMKIYEQGKTQRKVVKMYIAMLSQANNQEVSQQNLWMIN